MSDTYSINREFDFVRLDGLRRATGRPPHEWDIYIIKELIDNGLDADEKLWQADRTQYPTIKIRVEYINIEIEARQSHQLFIQVSNRAVFPVAQIEQIFATRLYTSSKAFVKGLTRGALGNALKTLLGIPYALHNRVTGDWRPELKPLTIVCDGQEHQPRYHIDRTTQEIGFSCASELSRPRPGTTISVGVDAFDQERPRTLPDLQQLAQQYHLVNPHVRFEWTVELNDEEWEFIYEPDPSWTNKYSDRLPARWYFATTFQDLLGAIYRQQVSDQQQSDDPADHSLPLAAILPHFAGLADQEAPIAAAIGQAHLSKAELESPLATRLYQLLVAHSPKISPARLGQVGADHFGKVLTSMWPIEGEILYDHIADASDPSIPFVIEVAVAYLAEGAGREVWTAVNFTPTYGDPFLRAWLTAPSQPDEAVLGLRGFLEAYAITAETPFALCLHLICPNVEHSEFSKTDINHLPFKDTLGTLLDNLLNDLQQSRAEAELQLEQTIFAVLDDILAKLGSNERFIFDQLLARLRTHLSQDAELAAWLATPEAEARLHDYLLTYQTQNSLLTQRVARPAAGTLTLPLHPDRYFSLLVEHTTDDLLSQHHVNKILYIQGRELEPVAIENNWLCQLDMALLHNLPTPDALKTPLIQLASRTDLPILILRDNTEAGSNLISQMRDWLNGAGLSPIQIVDLEPDGTYTQLVEMMPSDLLAWLNKQLQQRTIPRKWLPDKTVIRQTISQAVEQRIQSTIWEGMGQQLALGKLLNRLDHELGWTKEMIQQALDNRIRHRLEQANCIQAYGDILEETVAEFHQWFMQQHGVKLHQMVKAHLQHRQQKGL